MILCLDAADVRAERNIIGLITWPKAQEMKEQITNKMQLFSSFSEDFYGVA